MTDKQEFVGGYTTKAPLVDIFHTYKHVLAMIALVHIRGARKYQAYSWYNHPWDGNSTVVDNIEAVGRHFYGHSTGKFIDVEGLPHLFHMCCRSGMAVSILNKSSSPIDIIWGKQPSMMSIGTWITPVEIKLLSEVPEEILELEMDDYIPKINEIIVTCLDDPTRNVNLLYQTIMVYAKKWWEYYQPIYAMDVGVDEDKKFISENIMLQGIPMHPLPKPDENLNKFLYTSTGMSKHTHSKK